MSLPDRSPDFARNIQEPIIRALNSTDRPSMHFDTPPIQLDTQEKRVEWAKEVAEEIKSFACPLCGDGSMDHRWTPGPDGKMECLARRDTFGYQIAMSCTCPGYVWDVDSAEGYQLEAELNELVQGLIDEVFSRYSVPA